jgi:hypothetical protein
MYEVFDDAPRDDAVIHTGWKPLPLVDNGQTPTKTFGTISCGYETMTQAWKQLDHVFSVAGHGPPAANNYPDSRYPMNLLDKHPVDILVIDQGDYTPSTSNSCIPRNERWKDLVMQTSPHHRPQLILESWPDHATSWTWGPMAKGRKAQWLELGYHSRYTLLNTLHCQGALDQKRLLIARVTSSHNDQWEWPTTHAPKEPRPMGNLLIPWGLIPRHVKRARDAPANLTLLPSSQTDPMPNQVGAWIRTDHGVRRLQVEELYKGLGCSKHPDPQHKVCASTCRHTTSLFIWETLSTSILGVPPSPPDDLNLFNDWEGLRNQVLPQSDLPDKPTAPPPFEWKPPDLSKGGVWHSQRVQTLIAAAACYPGREEELIHDGHHILDVHRDNYDSTGANLKQLQLIWWEFPREHWDAIRDGSRMGFLVEPDHILHENSEMDDEQRAVATQFVDELIAIGAIGPPPPGQTPVTNTPLFCVPKPYQPGEWRVIADCKAGGQNKCIGNDPVYLNRPLHILNQMYSGGYTAVVDASKFFHQFMVHEDDRRLLGLIHPTTGELLVWYGLPMGSGSSPGLACQYGLSILRLLKENGPVFQKHAKANCWWTGFKEEQYDPVLGHGFSFARNDGGPCVKLWVHVDDFAVHGPDLETTSEGLRCLLDLTVNLGLLCHPKKLQPPSQTQLYVGFIFDTQLHPQLRIPEHKIERCQAMATYVREYDNPRGMSRLALSVVAGTLESVSDATPNRLGHTYLRHTYDLIHQGEETGQETYYTMCTLTPEVRQEMQWWIRILQSNLGRSIRGDRSGTLVPSWGDGSGTGTGGTINCPDGPFKMWMGQWSPTVYHFSSNWKELKTLLITLQHLKHTGTDLDGVTVFYFTDNSTTYWIAKAGSSGSPGLHLLIEQVLLLTLDLGANLQVIHVPGVVMIDQSTDGLSRGIWATDLQGLMDPHEMNVAVFEPLPVDMELALHYVHQYQLPGQAVYHHWTQHWGRALFNHLSVWFPPPELAQQVLIGILEAWVEQPATTSALLFIPRTCMHSWAGLSRHITELETIYPLVTALRHPPRLPIPVVVLYIPPHTRSLPTHRMEYSSLPPGARWHTAEAEKVRGLLQTLR